MSEGTNRLLFAHVLRGFAASLVVAAHYLDGFWTEPAAVASMIAAPPLIRPVPWLARAVVAVAPHHALGHLGVSLFFLVSGFVIPFSLARQSRLGFLAARLLRIGPTYAAGLAVSVVAILISAHLHAMPRPFAWSTVVLEAAFVRDLAWRPAIDAVVWTLEIEARFYLLAMMLAPAIRRGALAPVLAAGIACALAGLALELFLPAGFGGSHLYFALIALTLDTQMLPFLLIGTVLHLVHRGTVRPAPATVAVLLLFVAMAVQWPFGTVGPTAWPGIPCYALAVAVFVCAWRFGRTMRRAPSLLIWLADISYPLYAVHAVLGYVLLRLMVEHGVPPVAAIVVALVVVLATADLLHRSVEEPTRRLGRRCGRWITQARTPRALEVS